MRFFEFSRCLNNDEDKNCNDKNSIKISLIEAISSINLAPFPSSWNFLCLRLRLPSPRNIFPRTNVVHQGKEFHGGGKEFQGTAINQITEEAWRRLWIFSGSISRKKKRRYTFNQLMTFSTHPRNSNQCCCFDLRGLVLSFLPFQADPRR